VWTRAVVGLPQHVQGNSRDITATLQQMVAELAETDVAGHHRRPHRRREIPTVAVLGIDGSGKSTLSRSLAERLSPAGRACLVTDDVVTFERGRPQDVQPLVAEKLREAIGRRAKTARSLKSYKVPKLAELLLRDHVAGQVERWYAPDVIVTDGSPLLNMTAWARLYREEPPEDAVLSAAMGVLSGRGTQDEEKTAMEAFPELRTLKRLHLVHLRLPDAVLFLDADPETCVGRITSRGEARQVHETPEKLGRLREGYRALCRFLEADWHVPARVLDCRGDADAVAAAALDALGEMGVSTEGGR
jgi:thymidylate kinase